MYGLSSLEGVLELLKSVLTGGKEVLSNNQLVSETLKVSLLIPFNFLKGNILDGDLVQEISELDSDSNLLILTVLDVSADISFDVVKDFDEFCLSA